MLLVQNKKLVLEKVLTLLSELPFRFAPLPFSHHSSAMAVSQQVGISGFQSCSAAWSRLLQQVSVPYPGLTTGVTGRLAVPHLGGACSALAHYCQHGGLNAVLQGFLLLLQPTQASTLL